MNHAGNAQEYPKTSHPKSLNKSPLELENKDLQLDYIFFSIYDRQGRFLMVFCFTEMRTLNKEKTFSRQSITRSGRAMADSYVLRISESTTTFLEFQGQGSG
jgi:hypothetical protein